MTTEPAKINLLLLGATGLIGAAVAAQLRTAGVGVVGVARRMDSAAHRVPADRWIELDVARCIRPDDWLPHLAGIDAVINCAGVLQDSARDSTEAVHYRGPAALFAACEQAGVRRVIHLSAIGVDREGSTAFSLTKRRAEDDLMGRELDWVILRPSVVVGRAAYGGSALFRSLAALPLLPRVVEGELLQVVQLDDVARSFLHFIAPDAPARLALDIAGPERLSFDEVIATYRQWLGWPPAQRIGLPSGLFNLVFGLGDIAGAFGWRAPIRTTARRELLRGAVGDPSEWMRLTGIDPLSLRTALQAEPASVQERWFARLYLLKAVVFVVLPLFWILTGVISLGPGYEAGREIVAKAGGGAFSGLFALSGALADIAIGAGIAFRRTAPLALWAAIGLSVFYLAASTLLAPELWVDPLGPLVKIAPILVLHLLALALVRDR